MPPCLRASRPTGQFLNVAPPRSSLSSRPAALPSVGPLSPEGLSHANLLMATLTLYTSSLSTEPPTHCCHSHLETKPPIMPLEGELTKLSSQIATSLVMGCLTTVPDTWCEMPCPLVPLSFFNMYKSSAPPKPADSRPLYSVSKLTTVCMVPLSVCMQGKGPREGCVSLIPRASDTRNKSCAFSGVYHLTPTTGET